jgi:hypothetical protein
MNVEQVSEDIGGLRWFKSSYSGSGGGDCVEVAAGLEAVRTGLEGSGRGAGTASWPG